MITQTPLLHLYKEPLMPAKFKKVGTIATRKQKDGSMQTFKVIELTVTYETNFDGEWQAISKRWVPENFTSENTIILSKENDYKIS